MILDIFTLCDSAQDYNGKLVIMGAHNNIHAAKFPLPLPCFSVVARIVFDENDVEEHEMEISIKKNDTGACVVEQKGMHGKFISGKNEHITANLILNCRDVMFPSEGTYIMTLKVDDNVFTSELYVKLKG